MKNWYVAITLFLTLLIMMGVACSSGDREEEARAAGPAPPTAVIEQTAAPAAVIPSAPTPDVAPSGDEAKFGGTLRAVPLSTIPSIDPQLSTSRMTVGILMASGEGAFAFDDDWNIQPMLVDTWKTSSDGLTWTFTLRSDLKFHNDEPVTAEDVTGSWKRAATRARIPKLVADQFLESIEPTTLDTFQVTLKEPTGLVLRALTPRLAGTAPRVSPKSIWSQGDELVTELISTGPYRWVSWDQGSRVIQERWVDYQSRSEPPSWNAGGHKAYIDRIEWLEIPDAATRVSALATGEIDWLDDFSADFRGTVEESPYATIVTSQSVRQLMVWPNSDHAPFNDVKARNALMIGLDNEAILEGVIGGEKDENWTPCPSIFGCGFMTSPFTTDAGSQGIYNQHNIEEARRLLEEAGHMGERVRVHGPEDHWIGTLAKILGENLEEIGFEVEYLPTDWAALSTKIYRSQPAVWEVSGSGTQLSGDFHPLHLQSVVRGGTNNYEDPTGRIDGLFEALPRAQTMEEQIKISDEIQEFYYEEAPYIHVGYQAPIFGWSVRLRGVKPVAAPYFVDAWLEE